MCRSCPEVLWEVTDVTRRVNTVKERWIIVLDKHQKPGSGMELRESNFHVHKPFWAFSPDGLCGE